MAVPAGQTISLFTIGFKAPPDLPTGRIVVMHGCYFQGWPPPLLLLTSTRILCAE